MLPRVYQKFINKYFDDISRLIKWKLSRFKARYRLCKQVYVDIENEAFSYIVEVACKFQPGRTRGATFKKNFIRFVTEVSFFRGVQSVMKKNMYAKHEKLTENIEFFDMFISKRHVSQFEWQETKQQLKKELLQLKIKASYKTILNDVLNAEIQKAETNSYFTRKEIAQKHNVSRTWLNYLIKKEAVQDCFASVLKY